VSDCDVSSSRKQARRRTEVVGKENHSEQITIGLIFGIAGPVGRAQRRMINRRRLYGGKRPRRALRLRLARERYQQRNTNWHHIHRLNNTYTRDVSCNRKPVIPTPLKPASKSNGEQSTKSPRSTFNTWAIILDPTHRENGLILVNIS